MKSKGWSVQLASDIIRDGLGVELLDSEGDTVAEVFRSDTDHTVVVDTFDNAIPIAVFSWYIDVAKRDLGNTFEDGVPIEWSLST